MDATPTGPTSSVSSEHSPATRSNLWRFRLAMAVAWTIVIMVLCWIPRAIVHEIENDRPWFQIHDLDKAVHGAIFIIFAILWARLGRSPLRFAWIFIGGTALAIITELVQQLPMIGRDASIGDCILDVAGTLVGIAAAPLVEPLARAVETRLFRGPASATFAVNGTNATVD